jgi:hypothetical protein
LSSQRSDLGEKVEDLQARVRKVDDELHRREERARTLRSEIDGLLEQKVLTPTLSPSLPRDADPSQHAALAAATPAEFAQHPDVRRLEDEVARREQRVKKLRADLDELLQQKAGVMSELDQLRAEQERTAIAAEDRVGVRVRANVVVVVVVVVVVRESHAEIRWLLIAVRCRMRRRQRRRRSVQQQPKQKRLPSAPN